MAQEEKSLQFEVASIKPAAPDARGMYIAPSPGGRIRITNMPLKEMIVIAYRIQPYQISGGPAWLDSVRYDITAKAEDTPKPGELQEFAKFSGSLDGICRVLLSSNEFVYVD